MLWRHWAEVYAKPDDVTTITITCSDTSEAESLTKDQIANPTSANATMSVKKFER